MSMSRLLVLVVGVLAATCRAEKSGASVDNLAKAVRQSPWTGSTDIWSQFSALIQSLVNPEYHNFLTQYHKEYSLLDRLNHYVQFVRTTAEIRQHNQLYEAGVETFKMDVNEYADVLPDELTPTLLGVTPPEIEDDAPHDTEDDVLRFAADRQLPAELDLREGNCLAPIENQGSCGSCYAYSATPAIEYHFCKKCNQRRMLSEQQLIDCGRPYGTAGCRGGFYTNAWRMVKDNDITSDRKYPPTKQAGRCRYSQRQAVAKIHSFRWGVRKEEQLMQTLVYNGPITVSIHATQKLLYYKNGIFSDTTCDNKNPMAVNHALVIVGYGQERGIPYWLMRNSWSNRWGENGYVRIRRGQNTCGIAFWPAYPVVFEPGQPVNCNVNFAL